MCIFVWCSWYCKDRRYIVVIKVNILYLLVMLFLLHKKGTQRWVLCIIVHSKIINNICDTVPLDNSSSISVPALPYKTILHFFHRIYSICPVGRWGLPMHGVIIEGNSDIHWWWSYCVWVIKIGRIIMWNTKHVRHTSYGQ